MPCVDNMPIKYIYMPNDLYCIRVRGHDADKVMGEDFGLDVKSWSYDFRAEEFVVQGHATMETVQHLRTLTQPNTFCELWSVDVLAKIVYKMREE